MDISLLENLVLAFLPAEAKPCKSRGKTMLRYDHGRIIKRLCYDALFWARIEERMTEIYLKHSVIVLNLLMMMRNLTIKRR